MIETVLDLAPAYGWQGGPEFYTRVITLRNGHERRNARWANCRHRFILPFQNITDTAYLTQLKSVFLAVRGQSDSFLARDRSDETAVGEALGFAPSGGTAPVQLIKTATFGVASYVRTITRPQPGSVTVYEDGVAKAGTVSATTGEFTPSTDWAGGALTADFRFYVPVRFASDVLSMSIDNRAGQHYAMNGSVELVEVFGE